MVETKTDERAAAFRALHEGEPFVIPNPWDLGSARVLEMLGFRALATTSSGFAFTLGRLDGQVTLQETLAHVEVLASGTKLPVSVDLENGYGPAPEAAARAIQAAAGAGAVGGSIEDWDARTGLYPLPLAADRIAAAADAADSLGHDFLLTARAENHIRGNPDVDDTIERLRAYEAAGADVLYAPGLQTVEDIGAVCAAVSLPVNVLARPGLSVGDIFGAGAQRVSLGGSLAWAAVEAFASVAEEIRDHGELSGLGSAKRIVEWLRPRPSGSV
jgi:2-methylisocitrate lyase-like PEP mutase family enzyme